MKTTKKCNSVDEADDRMMVWETACLFLRMTTVGLDNVLSCSGRSSVRDIRDGTSRDKLRRSDVRECKVFLIDHIREADMAGVAAEVIELLQPKGFHLTQEAAVMVTRRYWDNAVNEVVADGHAASRVASDFLDAVALPSFSGRE